LPRGFVKVRHYGLLANRHRQEKLELCRKLLLVVAVVLLTSPGNAMAEVSPVGPRCCPECGSQRLVVLELPQPGETDTS
jgi:hypothetical protein